MKCIIPGSNVKVFGRAIHSLSKIGDELYIESVDKGVLFRTVNSSRSAFASFLFISSFFDSYTCDTDGDNEGIKDLVKCKVPMKSCLNIFKSFTYIDKNVDKCTIELAPDSTKVVIHLYCKYGIRKTHHIPFIDCESLQAIFTKNDCPNFIVAQSSLLSDVLQNFPINQEEVTLTVTSDMASLKNYIDDEPDPSQVVQTEMILEAEEFDSYDIALPTNITFCLKELRAILTFTEVCKLPVAVHFETSGKPIIFNLQNSLNMESDFVLATMANNCAAQQDSSQAAATKKATKKASARGRNVEQFNANDKQPYDHEDTISKASTSNANVVVNPPVHNEVNPHLPVTTVNQDMTLDESCNKDKENGTHESDDRIAVLPPYKKMKFMLFGVPPILTDLQKSTVEVLASDTDEDSS